MIAALNRFAMRRGLPFRCMKDEVSLDSALTALRARAAEIVPFAKSLVEINSYTANVEGVNAVGARLRDALPMPCEVVSGAPQYGDHLIWRSGASDPIVLVGHHDTVFPPGHFETWREADG